MKIGSNIKALREGRNLSRREFSKIIDEPEAKIQKIEIDAQRADHIFLSKLSNSLGVDINVILGGNKFKPPQPQSPDFVSVPRYDVAASAGHGTAPAHEEGTGHYAFNRKWIERRGLNVKNLAVISVEGDSMEPELHDQDLIVLDHSQTKPNDGDIFVVRYSDGLFVKRVQHLPQQKIQLRSTNTHYSSIEIDITTNPDFTLIGKVVASMHEW